MAAQILKLPDFCELFRDLLVEELTFAPILQFHYGKCAVIGRVCERDNSWYLQNISMRNLDEEYRLKHGDIEILLLLTSYQKDSNVSDQSSIQNLVNGSCYVVDGEAVFSNARDLNQFNDHDTVTVSEFIHRLRLQHLTFIKNADDFILKEIQADPSQLDNDTIEQSIEQFKQTHIRAIKVHTMRKIQNIEDAEEMIQTNMELRLIRAQRREKNNQ